MEINKILIVDDDNFIRRILKDTLAVRYQVSEAPCGESGILMAQNSSPDLIILDVEMPGLNGIEACRALKESEQTKNIPVILISAHSNKEEIILGLQAGADDYLTKPINPSEVLARVDAHLRYRSFYDDLERSDLQMLLELSDAISVLRNPMKILRMIVERVSELIAVDRCSIVGISDNNEIVVKASNDLKTNAEITLDLDRYPEIRKALETRRAVVVNDISSDPLMETVRSQVTDRGINSIIVVPIVKKQSVIGTLFLGTATNLPDGISARVHSLCHLVANISSSALENAILFESVKTAKDFFEEMAIRDGLTRLYTHRHFYDCLEKEFARTTRYKEPLSLIFFDIDDFKDVNDNYGHMRGDEVLKQIGRIIRGIVRDSDVAARYGGEEFAVLLPNTGADGALELARRFKTLISQFRYSGLEKETITVSTGIATFTGEGFKSFDQFVQAADQSMYKAKLEGKNRIVC